MKTLALSVTLALPLAGCLELVDRLREATSDNGESQQLREPPIAPLRTPLQRPRPIARQTPDGPTPIAEPMPRAHAQWIANGALFRSAPTGAPRPLRAPGWSLYSTAERQAKIILGRRVGRRTETALYALDGDRLLPERYREPHRVSTDETLFVPRGERGRSTSVVSVATGQESTPRPTDEQGAPLALEWVALDEDTGQLVVFGRRADGALFTGALSRDALASPSPAVTLRHPAPLDPTRYSFGGSPDALDLGTSGEQERFEEQPGSACLRARFDRDGAGRCITWGAPQLRASDAFRPIVLGRTLFSDHSPERARDLVSSSWIRTPYPPGAHCQTIKQLRSPAASLVTCREGPTRAYYHHDAAQLRWRRWEEPESLHNRMGDGSQTSEILEPFEPSLEGPADLWLDLARGALVETEPMRALRFSTHRERTPLLQRRTDTGAVELVVLDVEARTLRVIARFSDCPEPAYLAMQSRSDGIVAFGCQVQADPHLFRFRFRWTRAVDLRSERLYSIRGQVVGILPQRRELIVSSTLSNAAEVDLPQGLVARVALR